METQDRSALPGDSGTPTAQGGSQATQWHALAPQRALELIASGAEGLAEDEAGRRLERFGRNELPPPKRRSVLIRFLSQFDNLLVQVLLAAGVVTIALGHLTDAAVIFGVVVINAVIGFIQEGKAERALEAVRAMLASEATVVRGGSGAAFRPPNWCRATWCCSRPAIGCRPICGWCAATACASTSRR